MFLDYDPYDYLFKTCIVLYIPVIFTLKYVVENYISLDNRLYISDLLTLPWAFWCFSLSIFSLFGTFYIGKYLIFDHFQSDFFKSDAAIFYHLFILSKIIELIDTVFIVLRSKPLVALQWYHHWATLLICYCVTYLQCDKLVILFFMNYFVHTFMYFYFGLYCFNQGKFMRNIFGTFVNVIQTLQMLLAVVISFYIYNYEIDSLICLIEIEDQHLTQIYYYGIAMYISYFVLFIQVFYERSKRLKNVKYLEKNK